MAVMEISLCSALSLRPEVAVADITLAMVAVAAAAVAAVQWALQEAQLNPAKEIRAVAEMELHQGGPEVVVVPAALAVPVLRRVQVVQVLHGPATAALMQAVAAVAADLDRDIQAVGQEVQAVAAMLLLILLLGKVETAERTKEVAEVVFLVAEAAARESAEEEVLE
jgi:hypothetical protein